jgi:hypothetical protein
MSKIVLVTRRPQSGWLQVPQESRGFFLFSCAYFWSPPEFMQEGIWIFFDSIGDDFAQDRCELESVPAIASSDN